MKLISRLTDYEVSGYERVLVNRISRYSSRGILIDNEGRVALMYMSVPGLYKLPGGGFERGETKEQAFLREIREETGCDAEIFRELGMIEEHKGKTNFLQISYCFAALTASSCGEPELSRKEREKGMQVRWFPPDEALAVMRRPEQTSTEYPTRFMLARDLLIVEEAARQWHAWHTASKNA